jgi:hypothetical protein
MSASDRPDNPAPHFYAVAHADDRPHATAHFNEHADGNAHGHTITNVDAPFHRSHDPDSRANQ